MIEIIQGLPDNALGIIGSEKIKKEDYDTVLIPTIIACNPVSL